MKKGIESILAPEPKEAYKTRFLVLTINGWVEEEELIKRKLKSLLKARRGY